MPDSSAYRGWYEYRKDKKDTNHQVRIQFQQKSLAGSLAIHYDICKLINSIWNQEELPQKMEGVDHFTHL